MDFNKLWTDYKDLILVFATVIATLIFNKILPWLWQQLIVKPWNIVTRKINRKWGKRGFEKNYLNWLIEEYRHLKIRGLRMQAVVSPEIEDIYVPLSGQASLHISSSQASEANRIDETPAPIANMIAEKSRLVILGNPGSGKTTLLRYIAVCYARILRNNRSEGDKPKQIREKLGLNSVLSTDSRNKSIEKNYLPLLISLRSIDFSNCENPIINIKNLALGLYLKSSCPDGYIEGQLEKGNCLILLDGLDEVPSDCRRKIVEWIEDLVAVRHMSADDS